ncbi:hypothetical protein [Branchiibius sp. NY16-3462-2]|uniref:hypothetical protein n=1 Tax=Branchiibius sp. NY16-3462-2 TaxID=1807500 RepID=UPI000794974E|nr:hypothetical protein [Branchiibius sp. NY16-3462-2]KYH43221.1 hypothetical protein AZH51_12765 [Branchiibius sp. NY16-3462-2]
MSAHTIDPAQRDATQRLVIQRTIRGIWAGLPALLAGSVALTLAVTAGVVLGGGFTPWSLLLTALLAGPPITGLAQVCHDIVIEDDATIRGWARATRRTARTGIGLLLVPAIPAALLMVAVVVHERTGSALWLAPMAASASATVLAVFTLLAALPATVARPDLRGVALWATALHLVARWPVRFVAPLTVLGLGLWAGLSITGTLLPLVPGPVLLLAAAAFWASAVELGATDLKSPEEHILDERTASS